MDFLRDGSIHATAKEEDENEMMELGEVLGLLRMSLSAERRVSSSEASPPPSPVAIFVLRLRPGKAADGSGTSKFGRNMERIQEAILRGQFQTLRFCHYCVVLTLFSSFFSF